jgi:hypothetical protein
VTIKPIRFILFCFSLLLLISSCKKINEATDIGGDVIPVADGVNTFDTSLKVEIYDSIFDPEKDSVRVTYTDDHILGNIIMDPIFGKTNAKMFFQVRPEGFPWGFSGIYNKDSLHLDSVVLVLGWNGTYGDNSALQRVRVLEMDQSNVFKIDSFYLLGKQYFSYSNLLGTKDFYPAQLKDSVKAFQDTTAGQLRIKLDNSFGRRLLDYDTTNAYASDSAFKTYFKGFAVDADVSFGNALMAFGLANNPKTKLAIYYRFTKGGQDDTTVSYFHFTEISAHHNYIKRDLGSQVLNGADDQTQDNIGYLINTPGTFSSVKIPAIRSLSNRIINRAELIVEQVYDPSDNTFGPPPGMMLDVFDSANGFFKYVPYDFALDQQGSPLSTFGLYGKNTIDAAGNPIRVWKFNLTRYLQNVLTKQEPLHNFRLHTPYFVVERLKEGFLTNNGSYRYFTTYLNPQFAFGRVRVGGGNHPTQRMRLRIVYTKI